MKNLNQIFVLAIMAVTITSCKTAQREQIETSVDNYTTYVDAVSNVALTDASERWDEIENSVRDRKNEVENRLQSIEDKRQYEEKIETSSKNKKLSSKMFLTKNKKQI